MMGLKMQKVKYIIDFSYKGIWTLGWEVLKFHGIKDLETTTEKNLKSFLFQTILLWWMLWNVVITRTRNRQWQIQNSNIFFFVVCKRLLSHVTEILIDDTREMTITNYKCTRRGKSPVDSDYMTMMLKINLNVLPHKPQRVEMFHKKKKEGQLLFKKKTSKTKDCF